MKTPTIGLLALQGDFGAHQQILETLGASTRRVRARLDLDDLDGLIIPGGESTVMSRLCERYGLFEPLKSRIEAGLPVFGTCAGLIFLAREIEGASANFAQKTLGVLDVSVARNAYGTQRDSFESEVEIPLLEAPVKGVFIRAPQIVRVGAGVEILARHRQVPVVVRQNGILASSFHPEIAGDSSLHHLWLSGFGQSSNSSERGTP